MALSVVHRLYMERGVLERNLYKRLKMTRPIA
jgi:hypothetical protein